MFDQQVPPIGAVRALVWPVGKRPTGAVRRSPAPTTYLESGRAAADELRLVDVALPADVVDELRLLVVWLSLQLGHQAPVDVLLRRLVLGGLVHAEEVLLDLRRERGQDARRELRS